MYNTKLIGAKIKEIRKRKKISQEALAERVSMNHRSIVRLENAYSQPTLETLEKIADALGVKITDFFEIATTGKTRTQIVADINNCMDSMSDEELNTFYKAIYYFVH